MDNSKKILWIWWNLRNYKRIIISKWYPGIILSELLEKFNGTFVNILRTSDSNLYEFVGDF